MGRGTAYSFVVDHLGKHVRPGLRVLETGCGAAKYRGPVTSLNAAYVGSDVLNDHYQAPGDVDVYCSAIRLPFPDGTFDLVFNQGAIDYMPGLDAPLAEAFRVLKPRAKLIIYTYRYDVLLQINRNCRTSARKWERDHHVFTEDEMMAALARQGFDASNVTGELRVWFPEGRWASLVGWATGDTYRRRAEATQWRAFLGVKAGRGHR